MHYILDGYNIIYKLPNLGGVSIRDSREKLVKYILIQKKHLSRRNKVTIVFDGGENVCDYPFSNTSNIEILFSRKISADDYIIELIKRSQTPKLVTVITDDKELQMRAWLLEATAIGIDDFFIQKKKDEKSLESKKDFLTHNDITEIREELIKESKKC